MLLLALSLTGSLPQANVTAAPVGTPPKPVPDYIKRAGTPQYPPQAYRERLSGIAVVDLHVDARGRVTRCKVSGSSGSGELDSASCSYARNIRFEPARDGAGQAVAGDVQYPVRWQLPS